MCSSYLCKSQLLSSGHCPLCMKLSKLPSTRAEHYALSYSQRCQAYSDLRLLQAVFCKTRSSRFVEALWYHICMVFLHTLLCAWQHAKSCAAGEKEKIGVCLNSPILQGRSGKLLTYFHSATTSYAIWELRLLSDLQWEASLTELSALQTLQFIYFRVLQPFKTKASLPLLDIISFRRKTGRFCAIVHFELCASSTLHSQPITRLLSCQGHKEVALCGPLSARNIVQLQSWNNCREWSPGQIHDVLMRDGCQQTPVKLSWG